MTSLSPPPYSGAAEPVAVNWKWILNTFGPLLALGFIYLLFWFTAGEDFRSAETLQTIVRQTTLVGLAALGMTVIIIVGGIDLSVGSILGLTAVSVALLLRDAGWGPLAAALGGVAVGCACGIINGLAVVGLRIVSFIATLGMMLVARGAAIGLASGTKVEAGGRWLRELVRPGGPDLQWSGPTLAILVTSWIVVGLVALAAAVPLARAVHRHIRTLRPRAAAPLAGAAALAWYALAALVAWQTYTWAAGIWLLAALAILMAGLLRYTRFGRHLFAVGSNEQTARLCGVRVARVKVAAFCLGGAFAGLAGLMSFARLTVGDCKAGEAFELDVIAAVVIGGGSLAGGEGSILGSLVGALIMSVIATGCTHMGLDNWVQKIITGLIIIAAVALDRLRHRRSA